LLAVTIFVLLLCRTWNILFWYCLHVSKSASLAG
jgi:hypothetical protein